MIGRGPRARSGRRLRATPARIAGLSLLVAGCAPHVSPSELSDRIEAGNPPVILDVRSEGEYADAHVPGAVHVPFYAILSRRDEVPSAAGEPVIVYCEHGPRAGLARVGLWMAGVGDVRFLEGHMSAWKAAGLPTEAVR